MSPIGVGDVVDGLVEQLAQRLPVLVDEINAQHPFDQIDHAASILDHVPPVETLYQTPVVGVAEGPQRLEDDIGTSATAVSELVVVCYLQAAEQQRLVTHLRRWRTVLLGACLPAGRVIPHATLPGVNAAYSVALVRIDPGRTIGEMDAEQVATWLSWVRLVLEVRHDEEWA